MTLIPKTASWTKCSAGLKNKKPSLSSAVGTILTCEPTSRNVQNCKSLLLSKGIHPGQVFAATRGFVNLMLASGTEDDSARRHKGETSKKHLRDLVYEAVERNVSDIHIQVRPTYTKIRMRLHGELHLYAEWSEKLGREIAAVAFNKETDHATSHFNPNVPQDASMPLKIHAKKFVSVLRVCRHTRL